MVRECKKCRFENRCTIREVHQDCTVCALFEPIEQVKQEKEESITVEINGEVNEDGNTEYMLTVVDNNVEPVKDVEAEKILRDLVARNLFVMDQGTNACPDYVIVGIDNFVKDTLNLLQSQPSMPTDEEIAKWVKSHGYYGICTEEYHEGLEEGAKWLRGQVGEVKGSEWKPIEYLSEDFDAERILLYTESDDLTMKYRVVDYQFAVICKDAIKYIPFHQK